MKGRDYSHLLITHQTPHKAAADRGAGQRRGQGVQRSEADRAGHPGLEQGSSQGTQQQPASAHEMITKKVEHGTSQRAQWKCKRQWSCKEVGCNQK